MSKLQLGGALALIGVVVGSQLLHHDHDEMDGHDHSAMAMSSGTIAEDGHATVHLAVTGMTCTSCATTARVALQKVDGVEEVEVSYELGSARVVYDSTVTSPAEFIAELERLTGFRATPGQDGGR